MNVFFSIKEIGSLNNFQAKNLILFLILSQ